jgi:hypothetical protein
LKFLQLLDDGKMIFRGSCHPERSEGSHLEEEILRYAQDDSIDSQDDSKAGMTTAYMNYATSPFLGLERVLRLKNQ